MFMAMFMVIHMSISVVIRCINAVTVVTRSSAPPVETDTGRHGRAQFISALFPNPRDTSHTFPSTQLQINGFYLR